MRLREVWLMTQHLNGVQRKEGLGWAWGGGVSGKRNTNERQQAAEVERVGSCFWLWYDGAGHRLNSAISNCWTAQNTKQKLSPDVAQQIALHSPQLPAWAPTYLNVSNKRGERGKIGGCWASAICRDEEAVQRRCLRSLHGPGESLNSQP